MKRRRKDIGKQERMAGCLHITASSVSYKEVIDLAIKHIPEVDLNVKQIISKLEEEGIKVEQGGRYRGTCVSGL